MLRLVGVVSALFISALIGTAVEAQEEPWLSLTVINPEEKPIPEAHVGVFHQVGPGMRSIPLWQCTDAQGKAVFSSPKDSLLSEARSLVVLVSTAGYLPVRKEIPDFKPGMNLTVQMKQGKPFQIILNNETGKSIPDNFEPFVYKAIPDDYNPLAYRIDDGYSTIFEYLDLASPEEGTPLRLYPQFAARRLSPTQYEVSLPPDWNQPLMLMVYHPGFLRGFYTVISADQVRSGSATITLPRSSTLTVQLDASKAKGTLYKVFTYELEMGIEAGMSFLLTVESIRVDEPKVLTYDDLYGSYWAVELTGSTFDPYQPSESESPDDGKAQEESKQTPIIGEYPYWKRERVDLTEGKEVKVALVYEPADPNKYRGELSHRVQVYASNSAPAKAKPYQLKMRTPEQQEIVIAEGTLDEEGRAEFQNLAEDAYYELYVGGVWVGGFSLNASDFQRNTFRLPPMKGEAVPDLTITDVETGQRFRLADLKGKWVYINFWATWCGPCRDAMKRLAKEAETLKQQYGERVVLLTLSIDDEMELVLPYLRELNLIGKARHAWAGEGGWNGPVGVVFAIHSIPDAVLINPEGVLVWRGNPREGLDTILQAVDKAPPQE